MVSLILFLSIYTYLWYYRIIYEEHENKIPESIISIYHNLVNHKDDAVKISWFKLYMRGITQYEYYYTKDMLGFIEKGLYRNRSIFNRNTESIIEALSLYAPKRHKFTNSKTTMDVIKELFVKYRSNKIMEWMSHAIRINHFKIDLKVSTFLTEMVTSHMENKERKRLAFKCLLYCYQISSENIRDDTIEMVNQVLNQKDHHLVLICLELLQVLPTYVFDHSMLEKLFDIDYKNNKELKLMLDTSRIVFEKLGYVTSDQQARYMLDIVSGHVELNNGDLEIQAVI